ncbi:MAG: Type 1 glutamine amidotransferase-like domain-containing protein [Candidatus Aenigmarchaeota archaeon]|nr:Type 1 glutamine amidotransferase-like domain-containing protein [Candidatus Aenigmarchaeota archaeon]
MDILLASDASALIEKAVKGGNLAFIPTAADTYKNKWWIKEDKIKLGEKGFDLTKIDLKRKVSLKELKKFDIIYVAGGNSFYLLEKIRESGFDKAIKKLIEKEITYVGSSAGAVVAGPDIWPIRFLDDPSKTKLRSFKGLNLVDFIPLPHFGNNKYSKPYEKVMKGLEKAKYKYIKIRENQAVFVKDNKVKIIEA